MGRMPGPLGVHEVISSDTAMGFNRRPGPSGIDDLLPAKSEETLFKPATQARVDFAFVISEGLLSIHVSGFEGVLQATSGRLDACMNSAALLCQLIKDTGPIPVGTYYIDPQELDAAGALINLGRLAAYRADWGSFRVPLHPDTSTVTYGRSGFFLHGGMRKGSAGCIDVGGGLLGNEGTKKLVQAILSRQRDLVLEVRL